MITIVIDSFDGRLTRKTNGELASGMVKYATSYGTDPFSDPGNLTWLEAPTQIDPSGSVITDLIMAQRTRLESGITYVYAIGHTGRLYKIQVNDPTAYNPNLDMPTLLATLSSNSPTFKYGASIQFYGTTEKIYIGHDKGVTAINFDGSSETFKGVLGTWTQNVPRPSVNFTGKLYFGNGVNFATIDSTETVTTYTQLRPSFPVGTQVRDMDVSPDGNYIQAVVTRLAQADLTVGTQDTSSLSSSDSYFILWNGTDMGYTSYNPYNSYSLNSNISFGPHSYTFGYDLGGAAIYSGGEKIISLPTSVSPTFNGVFSTGNLVGLAAPETVGSYLVGGILVYGQYDEEIPKGLFRLLRFSATSPETDVIQIPSCSIVSNLFYGSSSSGYANNQVGSAKVYFSTLETSSGPTTKYRFYKFTTVPTGLGTAIGGVYDTQGQDIYRLRMTSLTKKYKVHGIRLYVNPLVTNNAFKLELTGADDAVIANTAQTFTVGTNVSVGDTMVEYHPAMGPTAVIGLRITNIGSVNWVGIKAEVDIDEWGKR